MKRSWEAKDLQFFAAVIGLNKIRCMNNSLAVKVALKHCAAVVEEVKQELQKLSMRTEETNSTDLETALEMLSKREFVCQFQFRRTGILTIVNACEWTPQRKSARRN